MKATEYLFGARMIPVYQLVYVGVVFLGSVWGLDLVWQFVDMAVTFMGIPNLIALLLLGKVVKKYTDEYRAVISGLRSDAQKR